MDDTETTNRAKEEANIQRARGFEYTVLLTGVTQTDGKLWDFGLLVPVQDEIVNVKGTYLIRAITYSSDLNDGTSVDLNITRPEGYTVRGALTQQDVRIAPTDNLCQKSSPDVTIQFLRNEGGFGS